MAAESYFQKACLDPDLPPWNLWSYIDSRDSAQAFRLAVTTPFKGHEVFYIAAPNTRSRVTTPELVKKYFPEVKLTRSLSGFESLEDCSKARRVLGYNPQHTLINQE
jgi:nucleoside-diphosphate-sugar epimerase